MNAINVISPYKHHGMWVFDDARVGLVNAENGFTLIFSSTPFPSHQYRLDWRRAENVPDVAERSINVCFRG
jgi:hypothetical protein